MAIIVKCLKYSTKFILISFFFYRRFIIPLYKYVNCVCTFSPECTSKNFTETLGLFKTSQTPAVLYRVYATN